MKIKFEFWNDFRKKFMGEKSAVRRWDLWNKENRLKEYEEGSLSSSKDLAAQNHKKGKAYEFAVLEDDTEVFCTVTLNPENKHVGVNFIDPAGRNYLTYLFTEVELRTKLFLREVWYLHFSSETKENEDYRLHFVFDEQGNVAARKYDERNKKMLDYEGKEPIYPSGLYEDYPEFGQYEGITKLERDIPFDMVQ